MKMDMQCGLCDWTARAHQYKIPYVLYNHIKTKHPDQFKALMKAGQDYSDALAINGWYYTADDRPIRVQSKMKAHKKPKESK
jgi:hypothetical protein